MPSGEAVVAEGRCGGHEHPQSATQDWGCQVEGGLLFGTCLSFDSERDVNQYCTPSIRIVFLKSVCVCVCFEHPSPS